MFSTNSTFSSTIKIEWSPENLSIFACFRFYETPISPNFSPQFDSFKIGGVLGSIELLEELFSSDLSSTSSETDF